MNKFAKCSFGFLSNCVAIAVAIILIAAIVTIFLPTLSLWQCQLAVLLGTGLVAGVVTVFSKLKTKHKLIIILSVASVIRLVWIIAVKSVPSSDFLTIFMGAENFLDGNYGQLRDYGYLARFPHLVPMMLYIAGMMKVFGPYHVAAIKCVGLILSVLSVYLMYKLSGFYFKKEKTRLFTSLIAAVYPSLVAYSSTFCTETIGVPLFLTAVILFHKAVDATSHKIPRFLLCGAVLYLSNMFRGVAIIFLIAFIIFILIFTSKKRIAAIASLVAGYFIVSIIVSSILMSTGVIEQPLWKGKEPSYASLMLKGTNFEYNGNWNLDDARYITEHLQDEDLPQQCFKLVFQRLGEHSLPEIVYFYGRKFVSQWSIGDCSGSHWATIDTDIPYVYIIPIPFQALYIIAIFLSLLSFRNKDRSPNFALLFLLLCGFGVAFIILETQGRYSYIVSWIFIITAACGLETINSEDKYTQKAVNLYLKHKTMINYIIFGVVTTISNIITYYVLYNKLNIENVPSTIIAWVVSVIVAYITNKIWVFESKSLKPAVLTKEVSSFFACRFLTGLLDVAIMWVGLNTFVINSTLLKTISNVVVICLNYVASKLFIFKNKTDITNDA